MLTGKQYCESKGLEIDGRSEIPGDEFEEHGIPMIVRCFSCDMSMSILSCVVDDDQKVYCMGCSGKQLCDWCSETIATSIVENKDGREENLCEACAATSIGDLQAKEVSND